MYTCMFCFLITITAVYASKEFLDYTHDPDRQKYDGLNFAISPADCINPGPTCDGCDKRFDCIEIGMNEYIIVPLGPCPNGTTCSSGTCTTNPNPGCNTPPSNGYKFKCYQVGLFPDAFDCQKYHLCVPEDIVDPGITTTSDVPTIDSILDSVSSTVSDVPTIDTTVDLESSTVSVIPTSDSTLDPGSSTVSYSTTTDVPMTDTTVDLESSTVSVIPTSDITLDPGSSTVSYSTTTDIPMTDTTVDLESSTVSVIPTSDSTLDSGSSTVSYSTTIDVPTKDTTVDLESSTVSVIPTSDSTLDSGSSTVSYSTTTDVPMTDTTVDLESSTVSVIPTSDSTLDSGSSTVSYSTTTDVPMTDTTVDLESSTVSVILTSDSTLDSGSSTVSYSTTTDAPTKQSSGSSTLSTITTTDSVTDSGSSTISFVQSNYITSMFTIFNSDAERLSSVNILSYEFYCSDGFYFDPRTNLCRKKLVNGVCPSVTGPCKAVGDVGVLTSNPALYYVCINEKTSNADEIFPQIFVCRNNLEYDVITKSCLDPTPISGTGPDDKTCLAAGKFADSSDCNHYKDCPSVGAIAISRACPTTTYFDHKTSDCAQFTCADLEKSGCKTKVAISNELYVFGPHSDVNSFAAPECTRPGTVCKNCTARTECVEIGEGVYYDYPSSPCPEGTSCVISTGACTASQNPPCPNPPNGNYKFECHQIGVFPDPFDCQVYHLCAPIDPNSDPVVLQSLEYTCTGDFYYDSRTTLCRKKLINGTCPDVTAPCKAVGDVGVITGNPALYYICVSGTDPVEGESFPQFFTCLNNFEYNVTARRCVDPTPISLLDANGICIAVGKFADPLVCSNLKDCLAVNERPYNLSCSAGRYFNPTTTQCIEYTCADLDK